MRHRIGLSQEHPRFNPQWRTTEQHTNLTLLNRGREEQTSFGGNSVFPPSSESTSFPQYSPTRAPLPQQMRVVESATGATYWRVHTNPRDLNARAHQRMESLEPDPHDDHLGYYPAPRPSPPPLLHKVFRLSCASCDTFFTDRGMRVSVDLLSVCWSKD
jgi:hypothetical protein